MNLFRRAFLQAAAPSAAAAGSAKAAASAPSGSPRRQPGCGAAVGVADLEGDPRFARAVAPAWELEGEYARPSRGDRRPRFAHGNDLPADPKLRDVLVAPRVHDVLSAVASAGPLDTALTRGTSDRYGRISQRGPRADRLANRPLPRDAEFRPKPFMATLQTFIGAATRQG